MGCFRLLAVPAVSQEDVEASDGKGPSEVIKFCQVSCVFYVTSENQIDLIYILKITKLLCSKLLFTYFLPLG